MMPVRTGGGGEINGQPLRTPASSRSFMFFARERKRLVTFRFLGRRGPFIVRALHLHVLASVQLRPHRGLLEGEGALGANSEQLQSGWGAL